MFQSGLKKQGHKAKKQPPNKQQQGRRRPVGGGGGSSTGSAGSVASSTRTRGGGSSVTRGRFGVQQQQQQLQQQQNGRRAAAPILSTRSTNSSASSSETNSTSSSNYRNQQLQHQRYLQQQQQQYALAQQRHHPPQHHQHPQGPYSPGSVDSSHHLNNSDPTNMNYANGNGFLRPFAPQQPPKNMTRAKSARWAPDLRSRLATSSSAGAGGPPPTPPPAHRIHSARSSHDGSNSSLASNSHSTRSSRPPQEVVASSSSIGSHTGGGGGAREKSSRRSHHRADSNDADDDDDNDGGNSSNTTKTGGNKSGSLEFNESMSGLHSTKSMGEVSSAPSVKQTTVVHAMTAAMDNPQLFDIVLIGRAARVPAAKFVLASRNAGLQALLYNDPTATEVYVGEYTVDCLQALIEYCHTGEIVRSPLRVDPKSDRGIRGWAQLSHLANQYEFEALGEEADNVLNAILEFSVGLICSVYDEALAGRFTTMEQMAMSMIQESPTQVLILGNIPGVGYLSPPALEQLLMHELYVNDMTRILILTRWIEWVGRLPENVKVALLCASNIPLDTMDPNFLLTDVKDSGIFDVREVHRAAGISPPPSPGSDLSPSLSGDGQLQQHYPTQDGSTPLYDNEDYLYSPDGSLMEDSPTMSEHYKPKKEKRKKSKKDSKTSLMDGQCYQLRPDGIVIICSTDTPKHLPDFQSSPAKKKTTSGGAALSSISSQEEDYNHHDSNNNIGEEHEQSPHNHYTISQSPRTHYAAGAGTRQ